MAEPTPNEILQSVSSFYDHAFDKMVWELGAIGGIVAFLVGLVIPYIVNRLQRREFALESEKILVAIEGKLSTLKVDLEQSIDKRVTEKLASLDSAFKNQAENTKGSVLHLQAQIHRSEKDHVTQFHCAILAMGCYLRGGDYYNLRNVYKILTNAYEELVKSSRLSSLRKNDRIMTAINEALVHLRAKDTNSQFADLDAELSRIKKNVEDAK